MHSKTDMVQSSAEALRYPWENHPGHDQVVEVTPGVLWVRLKLPFRLNHVNIYLLADGDGWAMVDSGFGNEESIAAWTALFEGPLAHVRITRLIVTHSHPDHVGLAGWVVERFNCPLYMSQVEYLQSVYHQNRGTEERRNAQRLHTVSANAHAHFPTARIKRQACHIECRKGPTTAARKDPRVCHRIDDATNRQRRHDVRGKVMPLARSLEPNVFTTENTNFIQR